MAETKVLEPKGGLAGSGKDSEAVVETVDASEMADLGAGEGENTQEPARKPPGRPRADGVVGAPSTITKHFPTPTYRVFKNDGVNDRASDRAFFKYGSTLPTWCKDRGTYYVYRDHPILMPSPEGEYDYIDKLTIDELTCALDLQNRYGCGSYHVILNDVQFKEMVATLYLTGVGGNDYKSHPPTDKRITRPGQLDESRPENAVYISFLRGRGEAPEQIRNKKEGEDMAQATVVERLQDQNEKLVEKIVATKDNSTKDNAAAVDVVKDAAMRSNELLSKTFEQVMSAKDKLSTGATPQDATTAIDSALRLAERLANVARGPGGGEAGGGVMEMVRDLQRQVVTLQNDAITRLERQMERMQGGGGGTNTNTPSTPLVDQIKALRELNEVLDEVRGKNNPVADAAADVVEAAGGPAWLKSVTAVMPSVATIFSSAANMYANYRGSQVQAQPGLGSQPRPAPPPQPFPMPGTQPTFPGQPGGPGLSMVPQPVPAPNPGQPPQMTVGQLYDQVYSPLFIHLTDPKMDDDERGGTFAVWFSAGWEGEYEQLCKLGTDMLVNEFNMHPRFGPVGQQLGPEKVRRFFKDFVEWEGDEDEGGKGEGGGGPEMVPPPVGGAA